MTIAADTMISVLLNGETLPVPAGTIAGLLEFLALPTAKIAVERNLEIVPRSQYAATTLVEGDRLEIVQFVGGG